VVQSIKNSLKERKEIKFQPVQGEQQEKDTAVVNDVPYRYPNP